MKTKKRPEENANNFLIGKFGQQLLISARELEKINETPLISANIPYRYHNLCVGLPWIADEEFQTGNLS